MRVSYSNHLVRLSRAIFWEGMKGFWWNLCDIWYIRPSLKFNFRQIPCIFNEAAAIWLAECFLHDIFWRNDGILMKLACDLTDLHETWSTCSVNNNTRMAEMLRSKVKVFRFKGQIFLSATSLSPFVSNNLGLFDRFTWNMTNMLSKHYYTQSWNVKIKIHRILLPYNIIEI